MTDQPRSSARITTLLFDVMGTVVDDEGSIAAQGHEILRGAGWATDAATALLADWRQRHGALLDAIISGQRPWLSHRASMAETLDKAVSLAGGPSLSGTAMHELRSITSRLTPWADSPAALARLRRTHVTVALSNADTADLAELSAAGGLSWNAALSGELARSFKPDPAVYEMALRMLAVEPAQVMMVAAHPWDLRAAAEHGMATAYIARPGAVTPTADDSFDLEVPDLAALADRLSLPES